MLKQIHNFDLPTKVVTDLQILARDGLPYEVCGIIHSHHIIHQYPNVFHGDRKHGFNMDVDISSFDVRAVWHSHPRGLNRPSSDDLICMEDLASQGYTVPWIIVTRNEVTEWVFENARQQSYLFR